jgi:hypothetical protein
MGNVPSVPVFPRIPPMTSAGRAGWPGRTLARHKDTSPFAVSRVGRGEPSLMLIHSEIVAFCVGDVAHRMVVVKRGKPTLRFEIKDGPVATGRSSEGNSARM